MQSEIALSTTEAEYISLSQSMRELLPLIVIIKELQKVFNLNFDKAKVMSTVFEDNKGCIELATAPKYRPRTKHISIKYYFFCSIVEKFTTIYYINTKEQQGNIFTKPLEKQQFEKLRKLIVGW